MSLAEFGDTPAAPPRPQNEPVRVPGPTAEVTSDAPKGSGDIIQWACFSDDRFMAAPSTCTKLPPAAYGFVPTQSGIQVVTKKLNVDELLEFPDSRQGEILQEIEDFWSRAAIFKTHGFLHRRGYMFHGPAGSGKTCLVQQIMARIIAAGDIVCLMDCNPGMFRAGLHLVRQIEPNRRIVCVFEDIDAVVSQYGEDEILSLLDGESQINHVLNVATTNYPERLDKRLVGRPRRFDRIVKVGMPSAQMREMYFIKKLNLLSAEAAKWVKASEEFSFAACCELVISVICLGRDFDKSVQKLKDMMSSTPSSADAVSARAGFGAPQVTEE